MFASALKRTPFVAALALAAVLLMVATVYAVHTVTPGPSVDIDADTNGGTFTALNNISFTDDPAIDLANTNTFALTAPTGFEFDAAASADQAIGAGYGTTNIDLGAGAGVAQAPVYSVANTVATWTVTAAGVGTAGTITISGMTIRPTAANTTISGDGTANVTISGSVTTFDTPNAHPIDHVSGVLNNFLVEAQGGGAIATQVAGTAFLTQVTARDQFNNTLDDGTNNFDGAGNTADITSNVTGSAGLVTTATFTNGVLASHAVTLTQAAAGTATITATDTAAAGLGTGTETGVSATFTVTAAVTDAGTSTVASSPGTIIANGTTISTITVTLLDQFSNAVSGNTVSLAQGAGSSVISAPSGVSDGSGVVTFTVTNTTAETVTYTATDDTDTITVTQTADVIFTPATAATLTVTGITDPIVAGVTSDVIVTALDAFGNTDTNYTGTIAFTSSDGGAITLPANFTFLVSDNGTKTFTGGVTMVTVGDR